MRILFIVLLLFVGGCKSGITNIHAGYVEVMYTKDDTILRVSSGMGDNELLQYNLKNRTLLIMDTTAALKVMIHAFLYNVKRWNRQDSEENSIYKNVLYTIK